MFLKEDCDFVITVFLYFIKIYGTIFYGICQKEVLMSFDEILLESKTITRKGEWNYANSGNI